jgi:hypothetical protein
MKPWEEMTSAERKQHEADWRSRHSSTAEMAMARMFSGGSPEGLPSDMVDGNGRVIRSQLPAHQRDRIEAEINAAMVGVVEDGRKPNPITGGPRLPTVTPAGAARAYNGPTTGWVDPGPLEVPGGNTAQRAIEAMCDAALPHGPRPGKKAE